MIGWLNFNLKYFMKVKKLEFNAISNPWYPSKKPSLRIYALKNLNDDRNKIPARLLSSVFC